MQRRVAGLDPLSAQDYNDKVLERRAEIELEEQKREWNCIACRKSYTTENAYLSHLNSKRHRENEAKPQFQRLPTAVANEAAPEDVNSAPEEVDDDAIHAAIDDKIAKAEPQLQPTACLFCTQTSSDIDSNLEHMRSVHSFVLPSPDKSELADGAGILNFLASKIVIANVCLTCAREFRSVDAVRKHMLDKGHAKVPYETRGDKRELAQFYRSEDWVDVGEPNEDEGANASDPLSTSSEDEGYGSDPFSLKLPTGQRLGHRSLARYYKQRLATTTLTPAAQDRARIKELLADKSSALVPTRGGNFEGLQLIEARNAGEARFAGAHILEHRDQKRRDAFRTLVARTADQERIWRGIRNKHRTGRAQ